MTFAADVVARGLLHQSSTEDLVRDLPAGPLTGYIGFDPSATSLHVGSLLQVMVLARFQRAGHRPIVLVGGGTGMVGDPSFKETERSLLDLATLERNVAGIRAQLERYLDFGPGGARLVNNLDWLGELELLPFRRDIGKHFSVNAMIARDSVRTRLEAREQGISFTEFAYMLLQAYDFLRLHDDYGCTLQMGGSDQWGNIISGRDLIRRMREAESYAFTIPLITRADGRKFGKSEQGNVWLDPEMTSPYAFHQFWLNSTDEDAVRYLRYFTFLDVDQIAGIESDHAADPAARGAQRRLADEVTAYVHGADAAARARHTAEVLFGGHDWHDLSEQQTREAFAHSPTSPLAAAALGTQDATLVAVLADAGVCPSRGRARKDVAAGAVRVNDVPARDVDRVLGEADVLDGGFVVLRKGKKTYHVLKIQR